MFSTLLSLLKSASLRSRPGATCGRKPQRSAGVVRLAFRPRLEILEDRTLLSSYSASSVADLIADIKAANQAGGANTIALAAGTTFSLTAMDNYGDGANGLPVIAANNSLTIIGNGDIIERSTAAGTPAFRLFDVAGGASLTLQNLTLQGGRAYGVDQEAFGGAVLNFGSLSLTEVTVQNNVAQGIDAGPPSVPGGSARGGGVYSGGSLTVQHSIIQNNQALGGQGAKAGTDRTGSHPGSPGGDALGGGLYVKSGTVSLTDVSLSSNTAQGGQSPATGGKGRQIAHK